MLGSRYSLDVVWNNGFTNYKTSKDIDQPDIELTNLNTTYDSVKSHAQFENKQRELKEYLIKVFYVPRIIEQRYYC